MSGENVNVSPGTVKDCDTALACERAHAELDFKIQDKAKQSIAADESTLNPEPRKIPPPGSTTILKPTPDERDPKAKLEPFPGNGLGPMDIGGGTHTLTEDEAKAVYQKLWDAWGSQKLCKEFYTKQRLHSAASWLEAIRDLVVKSETPGTIHYVHLRAGSIEVRVKRPDHQFTRPQERPSPAYEVHVAPPNANSRKYSSTAYRERDMAKMAEWLKARGQE
jgi:hypothetical protein